MQNKNNKFELTDTFGMVFGSLFNSGVKTNKPRRQKYVPINLRRAA
ncbi:MAG: hypothetical protein ACTSW1_00745 [Candidatus Hodarchaeales archaeon]